MNKSIVLVLLGTILSQVCGKELPTLRHHSHNEEIHKDEPIVLETFEQYEKAFVDKLRSMEASDAAIISLAMATIVFIIAQVVLVKNFLTKETD